MGNLLESLIFIRNMFRFEFWEDYFRRSEMDMWLWDNGGRV